MKEKPLCTIIIATIGRPEYFGAALASVSAQTYRPLNILISDNAANPPIDRAEIQNWAPGADVRLVRHNTRLTAVKHANFCLQEATGEFVFLMSDDDLIAPDYINTAMECMETDSQVGVVISQQTKIDESFFGPISRATIQFKTLTGSNFVTQWAIENKMPNLLTTAPMLARRLEILEHGGFPDYPDGSHSPNLLLFKLCLGVKVGVLDGGYYYRIYPMSSGLLTPWGLLLTATENYDRDLLELHQQGRIKKELIRALLLGNTRLLVARWRNIYRHWKGLGNKVTPVFDIAFRILRLGWLHGLGTVPKIHRYLDF